METATLSTRVDSSTKAEFTHICETIGLSPSQAIKVFTKAVIHYRGIPFELKQFPNQETIQAMQELEQGEGSKEASASSLFNTFGVKIHND